MAPDESHDLDGKKIMWVKILANEVFLVHVCFGN